MARQRAEVEAPLDGTGRETVGSEASRAPEPSTSGQQGSRPPSVDRSLGLLRASAISHLPTPVVFLARLTRAVELLGVILLLRLSEPFVRRRFPGFGPRLLRKRLEAAGAGFAKVGQLLAHRHDVLPDRFCGELASMLDDLPRVPTRLITRRMERELRIGSVGEAFSEFEDLPLSAASVAQVHRARLLDGTPVVVKVIRPGVEKRFRVDLALVGALARALGTLRPFRRMGVRSLARELQMLTREELDFRREVRNLRQLRDRMLRDDTDHTCPKVFPRFSSSGVVTMEEITGVTVKELMRVARIAREGGGGDAAAMGPIRSAAVEQLARWEEDGITPHRTACLMVRSFLDQAMRHRLFHADPHAANLIVMKGGTLAWIDLGMVGWLDERLWTHEFKMREAIAEGRLDAAYRHLVATMEPLPARDLTDFEAEFKRILRDWLAEVEQPGVAPGTSNVSRRSNFNLFTQTLGAVRRAGLRLPAPLVRLYRTIIIGDMVVLQLDPSVNWQRLIREFVSDERLRRTVEMVESGATVPKVGAVLQLLVEGPGALMEALSRAAEPDEPASRRTRPATRTERVLAGLARQMKLAAAAGTVLLLALPRLPSGWRPGLLNSMAAALQPYTWWVLGAGALLVWSLAQVEQDFDDL